jgi:hypothetical protein
LSNVQFNLQEFNEAKNGFLSAMRIFKKLNKEYSSECASILNNLCVVS